MVSIFSFHLNVGSRDHTQVTRPASLGPLTHSSKLRSHLLPLANLGDHAVVTRTQIDGSMSYNKLPTFKRFLDSVTISRFRLLLWTLPNKSLILW